MGKLLLYAASAFPGQLHNSDLNEVSSVQTALARTSVEAHLRRIRAVQALQNTASSSVALWTQVIVKGIMRSIRMVFLEFELKAGLQV